MDEIQQSGPAYEFKPSVFGAPSQFRATPTGVHWTMGRRSGVIRYADIRRVQMSYRPAGLLARNFRTEIWSASVPKLRIDSQSWKSMVEKAQQFGPYREFVTTLHRKIVEAKGSPELVSGIQPFLYWPAVAVFSAVSIGLAGLIVRALQSSAWGGAVFVATFLALFLWQIGRYLRDNRPGRYVAGELPQVLLPPV